MIVVKQRNIQSMSTLVRQSSLANIWPLKKIISQIAMQTFAMHQVVQALDCCKASWPEVTLAVTAFMLAFTLRLLTSDMSFRLELS